MPYSFVLTIEILTVFIIYLVHYLLQLLVKSLYYHMVMVVHQHISIYPAAHGHTAFFQLFYKVSLVYAFLKYIFFIVASCYNMIYSALVLFSPRSTYKKALRAIYFSQHYWEGYFASICGYVGCLAPQFLP